MTDPSGDSSIFDSEILKKFFTLPNTPQEREIVPPAPEPVSPIPASLASRSAEAEVMETGLTKPKKRFKKANIIEQKTADIEPEPPFVPAPELFQRKGRVFSVINQKGGCGKTTTAINLTAGLALEGFDVLLIDLDAQANSTLGYGLRTQEGEKTVHDIFRRAFSRVPEEINPEIIRKTSVERVSLLPASRFLASLASELLEVKDWQYLLRQYLTGVKEAYHYVIIDCPPALNALTINALCASDEMVIPIQTHYFSLEGMKELFLTIRSVQEKLNPMLRSGLILPTLYDKRTKVNREMLESIRRYFGEQVFDSVIRMNSKLIESTMHGEPVLTYDHRSRGAEDYRRLAQEVLKKDEMIFSRKETASLAKFILQ